MLRLLLSRLTSARTWFSVGVRRKPAGVLFGLITAFSVVLATYVICAATFVIIAPWTLTVLFLSGMAALAFVVVGPFADSDPERPHLPDYALSLAALVTGAYFAWNAGAIEERIVLLDPLSSWDLVFAGALFLLTLELTRRTTGLGLTALVLVFVLYNLAGHRLDGVLSHGYIDVEHFLEITVFTTDGILGLPLRVAATYAFLFVLFGTLLQAAGGGDFFFDFAASISGRRPGGPAKVAVVSSGLYGMVSGSPTSDVVTTGSVTIPIMRRLNYPRPLAGAVEVAASTGGSLMPPVMGSAAFIMADYTGIEYQDIAIAALLPGLLYYLCVYSQVHFVAMRRGLGRLDDERIPALLPTLAGGGLFIVPLVVITVALLQGYTPTMVAVFGAVAVLVVAAVKPETRVGPRAIIATLAQTCVRMIPVAGACAAAGLVIGGITMTGLAAKIAHIVYGITDASLFPSLVLTAAITVVLGLGMPTPSAYILAAVLMGPLLVKLGVPDLPGHMFILYYAVMSAITPPVAVAAYAASSIAGANPLHIAVLSVRLALAAFIVPFVFVYAPALLLEGSWWQTLAALVPTAAGLVALAAAIEAQFMGPLSTARRWLLAAAALGLLVPGPTWTLAGAVLTAVVLGPRVLRHRNAPEVADDRS